MKKPVLVPNVEAIFKEHIIAYHGLFSFVEICLLQVIVANEMKIKHLNDSDTFNACGNRMVTYMI